MSITTPAKVSRSGMTLAQLGATIMACEVKSQVVYASESNKERFRFELQQQLSSKGRHVLVNYHRRTIGQEGGGHISPLAAYNKGSDMVLVADTATYKYPWTWVPVETLWEGMVKQIDSSSGRARGYVIVSVE